MKTTIKRLRSLIKEALSGSPITWDDIDAAETWASLSTIDPQAAATFDNIDNIDAGDERFKVGPRVIIYFDATHDAGAALSVYDIQSGEWLDANDVWQAAG